MPAARAEPDSIDTTTTSTVTGHRANVSLGRPDETAATVQMPKLCRGCHEQMPTICDSCSRKTTAYCRRCLQSANRNPAPTRQPRRLDDLEQAIATAMRAHPLPDFGGITGWTTGRISVHLPGHPPATILATLRRLAATGTAALIGDDPERYRLTG